MRSLILASLLALAAPAAFAATPSAGAPEPGLVHLAPAQAPEVPPDWIRVARPGLTIAGPASEAATLERLAAHADAALPRLASALGVPVGGRIYAVLAPHDDTFRALQPGAPPRWADATAWPGYGWIFLRAPDARGGMARPLTQVLDHELVHILLGRAYAPAPVPAWLQEGAAQVLSGEAGPELTARLHRGMALVDRPPALDDLIRGFPVDPHRADLAYALSADLVHYLQRTWGEDALRGLVRAGAAGRGVEAALHGVTGLDLATLDAQWRARLPSRSAAWMSAEVLDGGLWAALALVFAGVGAGRVLSRPRALDRYREEQAVVREAARRFLAARRAPPAG